MRSAICSLFTALPPAHVRFGGSFLHLRRTSLRKRHALRANAAARRESERARCHSWQAHTSTLDRCISTRVRSDGPGSPSTATPCGGRCVAVNPVSERRETIMVSDLPVEIGYGRGDSGSARFTLGESTVIIRFLMKGLVTKRMRALAAAWIEQVR